MSFLRYPKYKDGGAEWLDAIPAHWDSVALKWASRIYSGGTPDKSNLDYWTDGTVPWLNSGAVNQVKITEPSTFITEDAFRNSSTKWVPRGALVMALAGQGKTKGMVAQLEFQATCNQSMAAIVPASRIEPRFLFWWLTSNYQNIRNMAGGDLRDGLNLELLGSIICPMPPFTEQSSISDVLDKETQVIDRLMQEQERLIDLLKEKCQAVISHAVTKGLNPDAPMKDSGIEWIGNIPRHWVILSAKWISRIFVPQRNKPDLNEDGEGIPWITMEQMKDEWVGESELWVSPESARQAGSRVLPTGAVIASCVGNFGAASINRSEVIINQQLQAFLTTERVDARFLRLCVVNATCYFDQIGTAATLTYVNQQGFGNMPVPLPPLSEQKRIVESVDHRLRVLDDLVSEATHAIDLLQERRTALISAAVTGKIDVRGMAKGQTA